MRVPSGPGTPLDAWLQARRAGALRAQVADAAAEGARAEGASEQRGPSFGERVAELVEEVDEMQKAADQAAEDFAEGRRHDIHGTLIEIGKADVAFRLLGAVRNRALEAYREIMRMGA